MNVRPRATAGLYSNSGRRGFPYDVTMRSNMAWHSALRYRRCWPGPTCSTVSAHTVTTIGAYSLQVGWFSEPPVVGQANRIVFSISPGAEQAFSPDLTGLRYTIVKDGRRVEATPGRSMDGRIWYAIDFTPSEAGAFSLAIEGPPGRLQGVCVGHTRDGCIGTDDDYTDRCPCSVTHQLVGSRGRPALAWAAHGIAVRRANNRARLKRQSSNSHHCTKTRQGTNRQSQAL